MYKWWLQGKEKAWELGYRSTLDTVNSLRNLYKKQGRFQEAKTLYEQALQGYENVLGTRAHVDARHGQQSRKPLHRPRAVQF
ncbi:hypothetical protein GQ53DRAFT_754651 [Thozetella sp. PMI_491]|nr:hypothetical protein GQ53DRAFT_754651 [Thozetella sp. PMI_491]